MKTNCKIEIADNIGFCFGVKRAIRMAQEALDKNKGKRVYSLGPIIHNSQVVDDLSQKGLQVVKDLEGIDKGLIVVASHGLDPKFSRQITEKGFELIDATCPYVKHAQEIVKSLSGEGYTIVILGDESHPEVRSLVGFSGGSAIVVRDEAGLDGMELSGKKIGLVSQTTQSERNLSKISTEIFQKGVKELRIFNTICSDATNRQISAARIAGGADVMIIVGGRMSANTNRLRQICSSICKEVYHVETEKELRQSWLEGRRRIGITSGASTPNWIIEEVIERVKESDKKTEQYSP